MKKDKDYIELLSDNAERRCINGMVEKREIEGDIMPIIAGVACVFEQSTDMGYYIEKVSKDAFTGCDMTDVTALFNHDNNQILSRTTGQPDDLILSIKPDGLHYEFRAKNECSKDVSENISLGFIKGSSFGFVVESQEWTYDVKQADGSVKDVRTITKFRKLYDVSPVTLPAYNKTSVALRSLEHSKPKQEPKDKYFYLKQLRQK
jgi:HK97 family phage prohead protease